MATYVNNLRLTELATGEGSGTWGTTTNTSLELIGEALGYNTQDCFSSDADATTTVADGATDPARSFYFKVTSSATLSATRTLTIAPNTVSRVMFIENATTGSQSITISQGSGANVTIATGKTAVVYLDGAGSGAAVVDAMANVDPGVTDTLAEVLAAGNTSGGTDISVSSGDDITFADNSKAIFGAGSDLSVYSDGTNGVIESTGNLTLDITSELIIDADSSSIVRFKDAGTEVGLIYGTSSNFYIKSQVANKDLIFQGNDDGSTISALTLDMSAAGAATFNSTIALGDNKQIFFGAGSDGRISFDGTDTLNITASNGTATTLNLTANNFTIGGASALISGTANDSVVINEASGDIDFRVESNNISNMLFVDAGNDTMLVANNITMSANEIDVASGNLTVDVAGDIILDADSGAWRFQDNGGSIIELSVGSGSSPTFYSPVSDADIVFKGNDGGSTITALTLDMSEAGFATFNNAARATTLQARLQNHGGDVSVSANQTGNAYLDLASTASLILGATGTGTHNSAKIVADHSIGSTGDHRQMLSFHPVAGNSLNYEALRVADTGVVFNETGVSTQDFRVESNSNSYMLFVDAGNDRIGVNTSAPDKLFHVFGGNSGSSYSPDGADIFILENSDSAIIDIRTPAANSGGILFSDAGARGRGQILYSHSTDTLNFTAGGTQIQTIASDGSTFHDAVTITTDDNTHQLKLISTDADSGVGPVLELYRNSASPADGDALGRMYFYGNNSAGQKVEYALIRTNVSDVTDATEDSTLEIFTYTAGAQASRFEAAPTETVLNESSKDIDFRVESDTNANAIFMNAGQGITYFGHGNTMTGNTFNFQANVQNGFSIGSSNAVYSVLSQGGQDGDLYLVSNAYPANLGSSRNVIIQGGTSGGSSPKETARFNPEDGVIFNEQSIAAHDFRVESDNQTHMLFVDAGNDSVVVGSNSGSGLLTVTKTQNDLTYLDVTNVSTTAGTDGAIARLITSNNAGSGTTSADIVKRKNGQFGIVNNETDSGAIFYHTLGTTEVMRHTSSETNFNESSADRDFRVESNGNTHMLFVDGGANQVHVATPGVGPSIFNVINNMAITNQAGAQYLLMGNQDSAGVNNPNVIVSGNGVLQFGNGDSWSSETGGTTTERFRIGSSEVVANESSLNQDFRVESDNDSHMLVVDAGDDVVMVDGSSFSAIDGGTSNGIAMRRAGRIVTCTESGGNVCEFSSRTNGKVGTINVTASATAYNTSSDARLKENIADADDAGELIDAIQVRQFDWIADGEHQRYGMVAQELNTVAPEAVSEGEAEDDMMGVDYSKLVPMLIKEIQSLRARVAQLESN